MSSAAVKLPCTQVLQLDARMQRPPILLTPAQMRDISNEQLLSFVQATIDCGTFLLPAALADPGGAAARRLQVWRVSSSQKSASGPVPGRAGSVRAIAAIAAAALQLCQRMQLLLDCRGPSLQLLLRT